MAKAKVGDVRPVYQQVGWEVCKQEAEKPEDEVWISTDRIAETEILADIFKKNKKE